jgi:hypothetical protein
MSQVLFNVGFNVAVELNGTRAKNYTVHYNNGVGGISTWHVPYATLDALADHGELDTIVKNGLSVDSGIESRNDYTLSHVLQAALFMGTKAKDRIEEKADEAELLKLEALYNRIAILPQAQRRPSAYPQLPRVALVAGHLAGRGITIQSPYVDFVCTSFCFADTKDTMQRGATNSQRFGRACGMLREIYSIEGRAPILIATEGIMVDAVANEKALLEKAASIENGTAISLKDLVSQEEWEAALKRVKKDISAGARAATTLRDQLLLEYYRMSNNGMNEFSNKDVMENNIIKEIQERGRSSRHQALVRAGLVESVRRSIYKLTLQGIQMACTLQ